MATEDNFYRTSSQYRYWSFTPEKLVSLRASTNALAAEQVRAAIKRQRAFRTQVSSTDVSDAERSEAANGASNGMSSRGADSSHGKSTGGQVTHAEVDCLTAEEELVLVEFYSEKCMSIATEIFKFPTHVTATAIQYLKRFYLSNSPMTYHPKIIMPGCLYLATKTENWYISAKEFGERLSSHKKKLTEDDVIAPEFTIIQGLRFTMDVRHPHRGLKGGYMELLEMARGKAALLPGLKATGRTPQQVQAEMLKLPVAPGRPNGTQNVYALEKRVEVARGKSDEILKFKALLTDAYFLYTPSQIWLAALHIVDPVLTDFYLDTKLGYSKSDTPSNSLPPKTRVMQTIQSCATLLASGPENSESERSSRLKIAVTIDKKLHHCRNPDKVNLTGLNKAQKRDQVAADGKLEESKAKRRKLEREQAMGDDPFGPELPVRKGTSNGGM